MVPSKKNTPEINRQIEQICESTEFRGKKKLCQMLRFIVSEAVSGRGDTLRGYQIGLNVFDRDKDFDPDYDPIVRIQAGRLRRSLYLYYLVDGKNDPIRIEIPKGAYVPQFSSSAEVKKAAETEIKDISPAKLNLKSKPGIAVLPFKNLTGDPAKDYFAEGFTEELSIEFTQYEDLMVISCRMKHDSEDYLEDIQNLAAKLGVHFLIEGSVRLDESRITILIKLLDGHNNEQVWAEKYQRDLSSDNLANIQEEIARETALILGGEYGIMLQRLSQESLRRKPRDLETYDAILRYYYYESHFSPETAGQAFKALEQAIRKDPNFGLATAMLGSLYGNLYMLDRQGSDGAKEKMAELAEKALKLDPKSPGVNIIYAFKCFACDEKSLFLETVNKCLTMKLYSPMRKGSLGFHLSLYGKWDSGKALLDEAMNPVTGFPLYFYGATTLFYYRLQKYDRALEEAKHYDIPALFWPPMLRAAILGQLNRSEEARAEIIQLKSIKPDFEEKAYYLISRFVKEDKLVDHIIDGLFKAGMKLKIKANQV